jgi:two-component system sensor histidine kinase MprB
MSFRLRVTIAAGAATLLVVVATSIAVYVLVRGDLRDQIDDSLRRNQIPENDSVEQRLIEALRQGGAAEDGLLRAALASDRYLQVVDADGEVVGQVPTDHALPVSDEVVEIARGQRSELFYDTTVDGTPVRVYAVSRGDRLAVQFGRSLTEVNQSLRQLAVTLAAISGVGVGVAVLLGRVVAAAAVAPIHRLSRAAETITWTADLSHHITASGRDELAQLADSFNTMLDTLELSLTRQRQLVADASHELRTPLASVRTNVEVLQRAHVLDSDERAQLLGDIVGQTAELTRLVEDLVELARGEQDEEPLEPFRLDQVVAEVIDRASRNFPAVDFRVTSHCSMVRGAPRRVDRAVTNLVDNAAKWTPAGGWVDVEVGDGTVVVSDQGPGIDPVDLPHVFDRFYRSARARGMPGSGLGLAIVRQVADSHGGSIAVRPVPTGGAHFVLRLPATDH